MNTVMPGTAECPQHYPVCSMPWFIAHIRPVGKYLIFLICSLVIWQFLVTLIFNFHVITTLWKLFTAELFGIIWLNSLSCTNLPLPHYKIIYKFFVLGVYLFSNTQVIYQTNLPGTITPRILFSHSHWNKLLSRSACTTVILGSLFPLS